VIYASKGSSELWHGHSLIYLVLHHIFTVIFDQTLYRNMPRNILISMWILGKLSLEILVGGNPCFVFHFFLLAQALLIFFSALPALFFRASPDLPLRRV
ncbi:hypothetical protein ACJX0J_034481, partial [Zea mays]